MTGIRWVASRKIAVVKNVLSGTMTLDEACATYSLSAEELTRWIERYRNGESLKVGNIQSM